MKSLLKTWPVLYLMDNAHRGRRALPATFELCTVLPQAKPLTKPVVDSLLLAPNSRLRKCEAMYCTLPPAKCRDATSESCPPLLAQDTHEHLSALPSFLVVLKARRSRRKTGICNEDCHSQFISKTKCCLLKRLSVLLVKQCLLAMAALTNPERLWTFYTKPVQHQASARTLQCGWRRGSGDPSPSCKLLAVDGCWLRGRVLFLWGCGLW